ncbi:MAG: antibiotic biosynthesis monooxygenase [Salaquimonas sp.]
MSYRKGTVLLIGYIDVPADRLAEVKEALRLHIDLTRKETGCIFFNVDPSDEIEGRFKVSEAFVDQAAFDAHQARARISPWAIASEGIPRDYKISVVE